MWIGIAASQVCAAQARGPPGKNQWPNAHSISPRAHHQMRLVYSEQMIGDDAIKLGAVTGNDSEVHPACIGLGPMTEGGDGGVCLS